MKGVTVESLLHTLSTKPCAIQFWDEFASLMGTFGLYKNNAAGKFF